eukprot:3567880-Prymnesium_polylepis.1
MRRARSRRCRSSALASPSQLSAGRCGEWPVSVLRAAALAHRPKWTTTTTSGQSAEPKRACSLAPCSRAC